VNRGDEIRWAAAAGISEAQRTCLRRFEQLRLTLNRTLQLGLFEFESHFARYAAGAFLRQAYRPASRRQPPEIVLRTLSERKLAAARRRGTAFVLNDEDAKFEDLLPQDGKAGRVPERAIRA